MKPQALEDEEQVALFKKRDFDDPGFGEQFWRYCSLSAAIKLPWQKRVHRAIFANRRDERSYNAMPHRTRY